MGILILQVLFSSSTCSTTLPHHGRSTSRRRGQGRRSSCCRRCSELDNRRQQRQCPRGRQAAGRGHGRVHLQDRVEEETEATRKGEDQGGEGGHPQATASAEA